MRLKGSSCGVIGTMATDNIKQLAGVQKVRTTLPKRVLLVRPS